MIVDSLRYWWKNAHRWLSFDLRRSSAGRVGHFDAEPAGAVDIESTALAGTKLIAEPGMRPSDQVGSFIGDSWREWNGRFRDDIRSFFPWR